LLAEAGCKVLVAAMAAGRSSSEAINSGKSASALISLHLI
jgi:hypothetical protein